MIESLEKLGERALTFPEKASAIIVHDAETLKGANNFLLTVKGMIKEIKDSFSASKKKTHEAHKAVVAQEQSLLEAPLKAEKTVKLQIGVYVRKVETERAEAERKAYEAEEERLRKEAEIEAAAQRLENHGHRKEADEVRETKPVPVVETLPDAPSLNGISLSKRLKYDVINFGEVPGNFLNPNWEEYFHKMIDSKAVTAYIKEHGKGTQIPGLRIYYEDSVSARA